MGTALPNNYLLDQRATNWTGLAISGVDTEVILEFSTAIDPIYTRSIMLDTGE